MGPFICAVALFTLFPSVMFISTASTWSSRDWFQRENQTEYKELSALMHLWTCRIPFFKKKRNLMGQLPGESLKHQNQQEFEASLVSCQWIIAKFTFEIIFIFYCSIHCISPHIDWSCVQKLILLTAAFNNTYTVCCWFNYKVSYLA